jgi:protease secretion system outer membrane protein
MIKKMVFFRIGFFFAFFIAKHSFALSLNEAYDLALLNDPTYLSAIKDYQAGLQNEQIGESALLPKLSLSYTKNFNQTTQIGQQAMGGPTVTTNWTYPSDYAYLQLTQPLFSLEALARWRQGKAQAALSETKFLYNTEDLLIRVFQSYVELLFGIDQLDYQTAERNAFQEQFRANTKLNKFGEATKTDVLESQSALGISEAKVLEARDAIQNSKMKLAGILGKPAKDINDLAKLSTSFNFVNNHDKSFEEWQQLAIENNAELKGAKNSIEIAKQEFNKNDAGRYPVLNLVGVTSTQDSNTVTSINQTYNQNYVGVQLSLNLYSGGEVSARSRQASANYEKSMIDYDSIKAKVMAELQKQYDALSSGQQKVKALTSAKESGELLVKAMVQSVRNGERTNVDVMLAQKNLFNTRKDLAQAKYNYLLAYLKLRQQGGTIDLTDFQKIATYFN